MLFSHHRVADLIDKGFEPAWQSVRPVPTLNIDLGNGKRFTRTLHGNVATMVLTPSGLVTDIIPGIYDRAAYAGRLLEASAMSTLLMQRPEAERPAILQRYHRGQARTLEMGKTPVDRGLAHLDRIDGLNRQELRDRLLEELDETSLTGLDEAPGTDDVAPGRASEETLLEDTRRNESESRGLIHRRLAGSATATPAELIPWLYRDVLHADLDDPLLGLGPSLGL